MPSCAGAQEAQQLRRDFSDAPSHFHSPAAQSLAGHPADVQGQVHDLHDMSITITVHPFRRSSQIKSKRRWFDSSRKALASSKWSLSQSGLSVLVYHTASGSSGLSPQKIPSLNRRCSPKPHGEQAASCQHKGKTRNSAVETSLRTLTHVLAVKARQAADSSNLKSHCNLAESSRPVPSRNMEIFGRT